MINLYKIEYEDLKPSINGNWESPEYHAKKLECSKLFTNVKAKSLKDALIEAEKQNLKYFEITELKPIVHNFKSN